MKTLHDLIKENIRSVEDQEEKQLPELLERAKYFGEQVQLAEDAEQKEKRTRLRKEWLEFFKPHRGGPHEQTIRRAYWDAGG